MKKFLKILDRFVSSTENIVEEDIESFDEMTLATCVLLIEVSLSDDSYDDEEKDKIIGEKDPSCIVADEFCTLPICIIGFADPIFIFTGFIFHRFCMRQWWSIAPLEGAQRLMDRVSARGFSAIASRAIERDL